MSQGVKMPGDEREGQGRRLLGLAVEASSNGIVLTDATRYDNPIIYVNPAFERITGYPASEVLGRNCRFLRDPQEAQPTLDLLRAAVEEGREWTGILRNYRKNGTPFWNELHLAPVRDAEGRLTNYIGIQEDVTARKEAEEALKESEERYEVAIRGSNDGIWDWDLTTDEVHYSPRWKEMLGYEDHELESGFDSWRDRIHPEDRERVMATMRGYLEGRTDHYELEHRLLHRDGSYRWILTRGASVRGADGAPYRLAGSHTDVTGRKELEERLEHRAFHDGLTGLPNRALFTERLEHALARAGRRENPVAVLFLDLDGFKEINDELGHEAGDRVLVEVARRLKENARPGDTVARLGGDEFTVLLEDTQGAEDAARVAERISGKLSPPIRLEGVEVSVSASIGVALGDPARVRPQDLVREADNAMYRSKGRGKGLYEVHGTGKSAPLRPTAPGSSAIGTAAAEDPAGCTSGGASACAPSSQRSGTPPARGRTAGSKGFENGSCSRCETLPEKLAGPGRLYLWLPLDHTMTKAYHHLRAEGWTVESARDYSVVVRLDDGRLTDLVSSLSAVLSGQEAEDTRALFKPGGDGLTVSDIPRAQPLNRLSSLGNSDWLLDMLSEGRLTSFFQPIVSVGAPHEIFAQECLLRGIDEEGGLVTPGRIFGAAKNSRMLFQTDLAARRTAIREATLHGVTSNLFINFTPAAVYDPVFCLRSTVEAVREAGLSPERIVFEVTETEEAKDVDHLKNIAAFYREKGFRVALDDVGSGYSSLNMIHRLRPDFIKLDMQLVRGVDQDPYKALVAGKVLEMARGLDVETIVEGVETEGELAWAREKGATFAQGYLFSKPMSPPLRTLSTAR